MERASQAVRHVQRHGLARVTKAHMGYDLEADMGRVKKGQKKHVTQVAVSTCPHGTIVTRFLRTLECAHMNNPSLEGESPCSHDGHTRTVVCDGVEEQTGTVQYYPVSELGTELSDIIQVIMAVAGKVVIIGCGMKNDLYWMQEAGCPLKWMEPKDVLETNPYLAQPSSPKTAPPPSRPKESLALKAPPAPEHAVVGLVTSAHRAKIRACHEEARKINEEYTLRGESIIGGLTGLDSALGSSGSDPDHEWKSAALAGLAAQYRDEAARQVFFVDIQELDMALNGYTQPRNLEAIGKDYGVLNAGAHCAAADAEQTVRIFHYMSRFINPDLP